MKDYNKVCLQPPARPVRDELVERTSVKEEPILYLLQDRLSRRLSELNAVTLDTRQKLNTLSPICDTLSE